MSHVPSAADLVVRREGGGNRDAFYRLASRPRPHIGGERPWLDHHGRRGTMEVLLLGMVVGSAWLRTERTWRRLEGRGQG
jgi:hypothetical protein